MTLKERICGHLQFGILSIYFESLDAIVGNYDRGPTESTWVQRIKRKGEDPSVDGYLNEFGAGEGDWGAVMSPLMIS